MKIFLLSLVLTIFISPVYAGKRLSMQPVGNSSPSEIKKLASGVCSIGKTETGSGCCTGFRIGPNKIMTNFHCLACVNKVYDKLVQNTPMMMRPSTYVYSLGSANRKYREKLIKIANEDLEFRELNLNADDIPRNNAELKSLLNRFPEKMNFINFESYLGNNVLDKTALNIVSIDEANDRLDYAILTVEGIDPSKETFEIKDSGIEKSNKLLIIGHPHGGPNPDKKSYDLTAKCKVISPYFDSGSRDYVFSHGCDTLPGNSGSPLIERSSGKVIGIHWGKNNEYSMNLGIDMFGIVSDMSS